jgi:hypothetical protein
MEQPLYSWIGRINIVKVFILLKGLYTFSAMSIKISISFFTEIQNSCESTKDPDNKSNPEQKNQKNKKQHWRYHKIGLQIIVQSHSNKNSMVLV